MSIQPNKRQQQRIKKKKRRLNIIFIVIFLFIIFIIVKSDLFKLSEINISGNYKTEESDIVEASGLSIGQNIFDVRNIKIEENIASLPYIKSVMVKKKFPKTMNIIVEERQELIQLRSENKYFIIDGSGKVLDESKKKRDGLLLINNLKIGKLEEGDTIFEKVEFPLIENFVNEIVELGIVLDMQEVNFSDMEHISIIMQNGIRVDFGDLDSVEYKLKLLNEILIDIKVKEINCTSIIMDSGKYPIIITDE